MVLLARYNRLNKTFRKPMHGKGMTVLELYAVVMVAVAEGRKFRKGRRDDPIHGMRL